MYRTRRCTREHATWASEFASKIGRVTRITGCLVGRIRAMKKKHACPSVSDHSTSRLNSPERGDTSIRLGFSCWKRIRIIYACARWILQGVLTYDCWACRHLLAVPRGWALIRGCPRGVLEPFFWYFRYTVSITCIGNWHRYRWLPLPAMN